MINFIKVGGKLEPGKVENGVTFSHFTIPNVSIN
jgi:hypothetical protein